MHISSLSFTSRARYLALACACAPLAAMAATLCKPGETDYFSCTVRGGRVVSLCGDVHDDPLFMHSWLQFRTGRPGRLALAWPTERTNSLSQFDGEGFTKVDVYDLRFMVGAALYGLTVSEGRDALGAGARTVRGAIVSIARHGVADETLACTRPDLHRYAAPFTDLVTTLGRRPAQRDMLKTFGERSITAPPMVPTPRR